MSKIAKLCSACESQHGDNCIKCNNWAGESGKAAKLCSACGSQHGDNCMKCGNWAG